MYFLKETADKVQTTENDILRRAMLSKHGISFFSNHADVYLSIWYTGFLWKRSTEYVLGGLREWNGLLDIRPVDVPVILSNLKPVYLSSFIEKRDQYIALESRPTGQSYEIDPYINTRETNEGVRSRLLECPERLVPLLKKVEVSRDNILVNDWNFNLLKMLCSGNTNSKSSFPVDPVAQKDMSVILREEEKPLRTIETIAKYCGVHAKTIKLWRKRDKDFPASSVGTGTVTALPSELNAWMLRNNKK
ncbi:hypothetical protein [Desulforhopalus sp. IMCC35007]|uniref:hypothetical protein n=1 Tax=Desulforhopalus sp. IMCC35007 TaxID=2569543 RepID=UPI0010AED67A|nr:hypothetical protein [Desulforhopalus sp. IMCC35007]TKB12260.1 hypothetical protein FCL48_01005 [Desulforhopalus sp. IMCC35007]